MADGGLEKKTVAEVIEYLRSIGAEVPPALFVLPQNMQVAMHRVSQPLATDQERAMVEAAIAQGGPYLKAAMEMGQHIDTMARAAAMTFRAAAVLPPEGREEAMHALCHLILRSGFALLDMAERVMPCLADEVGVGEGEKKPCMH